jgi:hypothetical protein
MMEWFHILRNSSLKMEIVISSWFLSLLFRPQNKTIILLTDKNKTIEKVLSPFAMAV